MKCFTLVISALLFFFSSFSVLAENKIYHWVDAQGKSFFSDTAPPGAKEVSISQQNLLLNSQMTDSKKSSGTTIDKQQKTMEYQATITSPLNDANLRSNAGTINIQVSTKPEKKNNQKLQLFIDGNALGEPQISSSFSAQNIDRGTHQLQVNLLAEDGTLLTQTPEITVHLQRVAGN